MRLLFITSTRIGDAVLSTGVLAALLERYPEAEVTLACGPVSAPLFEALPRLERLIVIRKRRWNLHWPLFWSQVVGTFWDLVVDLRGSATGLLVPHRRRVTFWSKDESTHRVVELARLLELEPPPVPRVWLAPQQEAAAARLLPGEGPIIATGPAATGRGKQWPPERFAALLRRLTAPEGILPGARVAVLAAAHERPQAGPVVEALGSQAIDLIGGAGLLDAAACLKRASLFVGNDSGLMHLSAAAGTPTLGLFGPTPEARYAPWGAHCMTVRGPENYEELTGAPDYRARLEAGTLMDGLTVERAAEAAEELWRRTGGRRDEQSELRERIS